MRIAVVHHRTRGDVVADLNALVSAARSACDSGATAVVLPHVPSLEGLPEPERAELVSRIEGCAEGSAVYVSFVAAAQPRPRVLETPLGRTALVTGDACFSVDVLQELAEGDLDTMVWRPRAESTLQAEAILEWALGCAPMLAGVLIIAECAGGRGHDGCQGTSAIVHAGEIVAEADGDDDEVLVADLDLPQSAPEPGVALPTLPLILEQRVAVHQGRKPLVEYPADLS